MSDLKTTKTFAEQIEEIRIKKKMNKSECSTVLGVNVQTYWNWTSGRAAPDYDRANNLLEKLKKHKHIPICRLCRKPLELEK